MMRSETGSVRCAGPVGTRSKSSSVHLVVGIKWKLTMFLIVGEPGGNLHRGENMQTPCRRGPPQPGIEPRTILL